MVSSWKSMKGIKVGNRCPECKGLFSDEEYDSFSDSCLYCKFSGSGKSLPAPIIHSFGDNRNVTSERLLLDNIAFTPEKQSKAASESIEKFKNRKLYK